MNFDRRSSMSGRTSPVCGMCGRSTLFDVLPMVIELIYDKMGPSLLESSFHITIFKPATVSISFFDVLFARLDARPVPLVLRRAFGELSAVVASATKTQLPFYSFLLLIGAVGIGFWLLEPRGLPLGNHLLGASCAGIAALLMEDDILLSAGPLMIPQLPHCQYGSR